MVIAIVILAAFVLIFMLRSIKLEERGHRDQRMIVESSQHLAEAQIEIARLGTQLRREQEKTREHVEGGHVE
jgi:uncharacterized coiled-coil protein SlyX